MPLQSKCVEDILNRIISQSEELLPKIEDVQAEKMGDLVDEEMQETAKAIELAAARIAVRSSLLNSYSSYFCCFFMEMKYPNFILI